MKLSCIAALLLLSAPAVGQIVLTTDPGRPALATRPAPGVAVFVGPQGGFGRIEVYEEATGALLAAPHGLRDLRLLPLDFVGRTELHTFAPDRPRYFADVPGASRLVLQNGLGSLYRYERQQPGGSVFGFLWIRPELGPVTVGELHGTGAAGNVDPWVGRVALAPSGTVLLSATRVAAGGNLLEIDLGHRVVIDRTATLAPLAFSDAGLWLADGFGFGVATDGVYRFERVFVAQAQALPFEPSQVPSWFSGQAVLSANRSWAAMTAGTGALQQYAFVFGATGPARRVGDAPAPLSGAGFLPESMHGPYLAVSDDGECCAWRVEGATTEVFLANVDPPAPQVPVQVTSDDYFLDTLEEIGLLGFVQIPGLQTAPLQMAVGARDDVTFEIERVDLFSVTLDTVGSPSFTNLTLSNGDPIAPFTSAPPEIKPLAVRWLPATGRYFLHDEDANRILGVDPAQSGATVLMSDVKDVNFVEAAAGYLLLGVRRDFQPRPDQLLRAPWTVDSPAVVIHPGSDDHEFEYARGRGDGWVGFVERVLLVETMRRVHVPSATFETFPTTVTAFGRPVGFTAQGAQLLSVGAPGSPSLFCAWAQNGAVVCANTPALPGHVLPAL